MVSYLRFSAFTAAAQIQFLVEELRSSKVTHRHSQKKKKPCTLQFPSTPHICRDLLSISIGNHQSTFYLHRVPYSRHFPFLLSIYP